MDRQRIEIVAAQTRQAEQILAALRKQIDNLRGGMVVDIACGDEPASVEALHRVQTIAEAWTRVEGAQASLRYASIAIADVLRECRHDACTRRYIETGDPACVVVAAAAEQRGKLRAVTP